MSLFNHTVGRNYVFARTDPQIEFFDHSQRPDVANVRATLDEWFERYPKKEQSRLRKDFRSRNNREHLSGFFELYCHELSFRSGYAVDVHVPEGTGRAKDFLCSKGTRQIGLEATVATDEPTQSAQSSERSKLFEYLNRNTYVPGFRYDYDVVSEGESAPQLRKLGSEIATWAQGHDRPRLRAKMLANGVLAMPRRRFESNGWIVEIGLLPRPMDEPVTQGSTRTIGYGPITGGPMSNDRSIRNTLKKKASHYKDRSKPYVLAIDAWFEFQDQDDIDFLQALLGTEVFVMTQTSSHLRRRKDGVWYGPKGSRNRHLSAVILANNLRPWSIAESKPVIYINEDATHVIQPGEFNVRTVLWNPDDGEHESRYVAPEPHELFQLPVDWPQ